jgi:bifunctional DNA-binding transcriptional regulator/antitoxin component of YhaV-PrlF toxin-antitoxin module
MSMAIDTAKMSQRGQIIIPKGIREMIGADTDTVFTISALNNETIIMKKLDTSAIIAEFNALRNKVRKLSKKEIEAEINAARN